VPSISFVTTTNLDMYWHLKVWRLSSVYKFGNYNKLEYVSFVAGPREGERVAADHGRHARTRTKAAAAPGGGAQAATTAAGSADTTVAVYQVQS
jgi:hypothetical protein